MKKTIFSVVLLLSLMACSKVTPVEYALFSGKIENLEAKVITLEKVDQSFKKEITIESNGAFSDTIQASSGLYLLTVGKNRVNVYLENENVINLSADAKDFNGSLAFSGKGVETTNYITFKNKKTAELRGNNKSLYTLEEVEFKKKLNDISTILNTVIDTTKGIEPEFKALEKRNINYTYLLQLSQYVNGKHGYWTKNKDYKPSEDFLSELDDLDINNGKDFELSNAYKQLVTGYYVNEIRELAKKDSIEFMYAKVKVHAAIPNESIKNALIFSGAEYGITKIENVEDYYKTFINASTNEENNAKLTATYNKLIGLNKGKPSPKFVNYQNHAGGTLSLDELKGKYTYIDIWATWCAPCLAEVPYLKKLEKTYHGKNINFLSVSIDVPKDVEKWKQMIGDKELGGIQVITDKGPTAEFIGDYFVSTIPRFILIDPQGAVVDKDAPRPSSPELIDLFNTLNI